jgi:hypothetical protein
MKIDFEYEMNAIEPQLKSAKGYLDCEKIIVNNIRKHSIKEFDDDSIAEFLNKLQSYLIKKVEATKQTNECINYRYAKSFVNTLVATPYWRSWIKTIKI